MKKRVLLYIFVGIIFLSSGIIYASSTEEKIDAKDPYQSTIKQNNNIKSKEDILLENDEAVYDFSFNNFYNSNYDMVVRCMLSKYYIGATKYGDNFVPAFGSKGSPFEFSVFDNVSQEFKAIIEHSDFTKGFPGFSLVEYAPFLSEDGTVYLVVDPNILVKAGNNSEDSSAGLYSYNINTEQFSLLVEADIVTDFTPIVHEGAVYFKSKSEDAESETGVWYYLLRYDLEEEKLTVYDDSVVYIISANKDHMYSLKDGVIYQLSHQTGESKLLMDLKQHELTKDYKAKGSFQVTEDYIYVVLNSLYPRMDLRVGLGSDVVARVEIATGKVTMITPDVNKKYFIRSLNVIYDNCFFIADEITDAFYDTIYEFGIWDASEHIKAMIYQGDSEGNVQIIGETYGVELIIDGEKLYYSDKGTADKEIESTFKSLEINIK
ncbi:hypothetical protein [Vallitalea okinawensis]|uniref:hypothetical protein n=1 Tax=Vallitalea okinawensis TaxID=2078660 RepID=UPI000CFB814A|nr:hypothetical protein [Vallitalea okinawensis]